MAETNDFCVLSPMAVERQQAMLPGLLAAVRGRRQRRQARRAAALAGSLLAVLWLLWPRAVLVPPAVDDPVARAGHWTSIGDDPSVLSRCEVAPTVSAEWFVDDAGLHDLLATDDRPAGVVRIGSAVQVGAGAIDPWGSELPADQAPDGGTGS